MAHFLMTDKPNRKTLPCSYPGCEHTVEVTKFLTPPKARCPEHAGQTSSTMRQLVSAESASVDLEPPTPNRSLRDVRCPLDDTPMQIIRLTDSMGWVTFKCPECYTAVEIQPRWAPLLVENIPDRYRELVEIWNEKQHARRNEMGRVLVGSFIVDENNSPGRTDDDPKHMWRSRMKGEKDFLQSYLELQADGFAEGTTVTVWEPETKENKDDDQG